jgi:hypothetical protein
VLSHNWVLALVAFSAVQLTPETAGRFDAYVQVIERAIDHRVAPGHFLHAGDQPGVKARLRRGETIIEKVADTEYPIQGPLPDGLHDWRGMVFIPGASLPQVQAALQDYEHYKDFYQPKVIDSRVIAHRGDDWEIFLRLYTKYVVAVALNSEYKVHYATLDATRMTVDSRSTRIAEAKNANGPYNDEEQVGNDDGFLWRLNSYWRFEESDGGVYAECEAISLSRGVPLGLGWMLKGFLDRFPKDSMRNTLDGTKAAVLDRLHAGAAAR